MIREPVRGGKKYEAEIKIAVDPNTLFANVDGIKKALEEASKAKAEAEGRKPQGVAKKAIALGKLEEKELRRVQCKRIIGIKI
jgi:TPP-dependent trihydroxycyclohexane-1,2-dione (THcHDO) dehydratase